MARTTYADQKAMYPNASDELINSLINIQNAQDAAYKSKNYDLLNKLYDQEIGINTAIAKSRSSSPVQDTSQSSSSSYAQALANQVEKNKKIVPVASTSSTNARPRRPKTTSIERARFAAKAAEAFQQAKTKAETKRTSDQNSSIASAASGPRNMDTAPRRPLRESPRGPYTPVKDYGTPGRPNFMPSGPSRDPFGITPLAKETPNLGRPPGKLFA